MIYKVDNVNKIDYYQQDKDSKKQKQKDKREQEKKKQTSFEDIFAEELDSLSNFDVKI